MSTSCGRLSAAVARASLCLALLACAIRPQGGGFSAVGFLDGRWLACGSGEEGCWASTDDGRSWAPHSPQRLRWLVVADGRYWGVF